MPNITETISLLDAIYEKPYWKAQELSIFMDNYPALRQAALDGERYKRAGEMLAEAMERLQLEFKVNACECGEEWKDTDAHNICNNALSAYRQAVEQKHEMPVPDDGTTHITVETPDDFKCKRCDVDYKHTHSTYDNIKQKEV